MVVPACNPDADPMARATGEGVGPNLALRSTGNHCATNKGPHA